MTRMTLVLGNLLIAATMRSMYSVLYWLTPPVAMANSPLEAAAAQSRSGKSYTTAVMAMGGLAPARFCASTSARYCSNRGTLARVSLEASLNQRLYTYI
jgi:hypothetical protein